MRAGISITITRSVRGRLEAIIRDRNASQKHAPSAARQFSFGQSLRDHVFG